MANELYLASTPLHILNSIAIASKRPSNIAHLILIDQPDVENNPYFQILKDWQGSGSPFVSLDIYKGRIKGLKQKLANRKSVFARLDRVISKLNPSHIYTGNDRRIEFQYAMHAQECINQQTPVGVYMDEGTFTYVGRKDSASISDKYIDNFLKKLTYGFWWKNPITIGGSNWIQEIYAAFPEHVHGLLKGKTVKALQPLYKENIAVRDFCERIFQFFDEDVESVSNLSTIFTLPHESIIERIPGYKESIEAVVEKLLSKQVAVGIKYHPRNTNPDILNAKDRVGITLLSHKVPFEAILPNLSKCVVVGDISSTLINSKFLKPECDAVSIANPDAPLYNEFVDFFKLIGVPTLSATDLQVYLEEKLAHA